MTDFAGPPTGDAPKVEIEMWTDLGCPWCYLGKHRLQRAIEARPDADRFVIRPRSFELNPMAPREPETIEEAFIRSHGGDASFVVQAERRIQALARDEGLKFSLDRLNANTFDVHRLLHFAEEEGMGFEFFSLVQDRFFAGALNPFDAGELTAAAVSVGMAEERVREILASEEYADAVRADREEGLALGVQGVPFTVFDRRLATAGAQSVVA
jgi:predicted DsbA family dithiol-disulfide isomerase